LVVINWMAVWESRSVARFRRSCNGSSPHSCCRASIGVPRMVPHAIRRQTMAAATREIVTLQLGHYSNFVGTHWWNIQNASFVYHPSQMTRPKEINNDVLFREGLNLMNEVTYTPRLIVFDLKGSLNTLKQSGTLYDLLMDERDMDDFPWNNDITMHKVDVVTKNEFL
jgi:hypothetical protein